MERSPDGPTTGDVAPDLALRDQHGQSVRLSDLRGRKNVLLVFYPYAFSGICTGELGALRDRQPEVENDDVALLAVSCDPIFALRAYADAQSLTFPLLSDFWPHGEVTAAYGVLDEVRGCPRRATFVIDRGGVIRWSVDHDIGEPRDVDAYVSALADLPG